MPRLPSIGDKIDGRYEVTDLCSDSGGMGILFFVSDTKSKASKKLVLKLCKTTHEPSIKRFCRETRLLDEFKGNSKVVKIKSRNPDHDPPYYVMKYYSDGDLTSIEAELRDDLELQEQTFLQMVDCIAELHAKEIFHRDIKPQNFLIDGEDIVVSDLGLSMERESLTNFTSSADAWGTQGFTPPEYTSGGFKNADAAGDVFMLGKSFYVLLTGRDPLYLLPDNVHAAIFHVVSRCCNLDKSRRYQRLADVKQAIVSAYDVILDRVKGFSQSRRMLDGIMERLEDERKYRSEEVNKFLDTLALLAPDEQESICQAITPRLFRVLGQEAFNDRLDEFLAIYDYMVRRNRYGWSFSEVVADCAKSLISVGKAEPKAVAFVLDSAIHAAVTQNQFAAMDTCREIITTIDDESYALEVRAVLLNYPNSFVARIELVRCKHTLITEVIQTLKKASSNDD